MAQKIKLTNIKFSIDEIEISEHKETTLKNFFIELLEGLEKINEKKEILSPEQSPSTETEKETTHDTDTDNKG